MSLPTNMFLDNLDCAEDVWITSLFVPGREVVRWEEGGGGEKRVVVTGRWWWGQEDGGGGRKTVVVGRKGSLVFRCFALNN